MIEETYLAWEYAKLLRIGILHALPMLKIRLSVLGDHTNYSHDGACFMRVRAPNKLKTSIGCWFKQSDGIEPGVWYGLNSEYEFEEHKIDLSTPIEHTIKILTDWIKSVCQIEN